MIRFHAAARELAGRSEEPLDPDAPGTVADLRVVLTARHPRLAGYLSRMRFAVDGELVEDDHALAGATEVDVLPPVAGGATPVEVRDTPLSIDEVYAAVAHPSAGGVALFVGVVRDHADGQAVARLDYEAHAEMANREMKRIVEAIEAETQGVRVAVTHRVGALAVGDLAVVVGASAPHRAEAFAACRAAIERIKEKVPIWKKEFGPDGAAHWVNLEPEQG